MRYKHFCLRGKKTITDFWAMPRPIGPYKGIYPFGFIERLSTLIPMYNKLILHQFGGTTETDKFNHTVDINPECKPSYLIDARTLKGIPDNHYDIVLADPPYDFEGVNYSEKLYQCEPVKPYSFIEAGMRVLKQGGYYVILHQLCYKKIENSRRIAMIGIATGPNMRIRCLNVFQKPITLGHFHIPQITEKQK